MPRKSASSTHTSDERRRKAEQVAQPPQREAADPHLLGTSPSAMQPPEVLALQRTIGNQAVIRHLASAMPQYPAIPSPTRAFGSAVVQRNFDEEFVTDALNSKASSAKKFDAGATDGAYKVGMDGADPLVLKATNKQMPLFAAQLAKSLGIHTPDITSVASENILEKIGSIPSEDLVKRLSKSERATVQKFVEGKSLNRASARDISEATLEQFGNIAAFDMMIGKVDLFENYDPLYGLEEENKNNFKNIIIDEEGNAVDIDLDKGRLGTKSMDSKFGTPPEVIAAIIEEPLTLAPYVLRNIGGMLADGPRLHVGQDGGEGELRGLLIQRGMLQMVRNTRNNEALREVLTNKPKGPDFDDVEQTVGAYHDLGGKKCATAIETINERIEELRSGLLAQRRRREQEERERRERLKPVATKNTRGGKSNKSKKKGKGCFLTTACVEYKGLADDCEELTVLRAFRDSYLLHLPEGAALVDRYYTLAPLIVRRIWEDEEAALVLENMYQVVRQCVQWIQGAQPDLAFRAYCQQMLYLKERYLGHEI